MLYNSIYELDQNVVEVMETVIKKVVPLNEYKRLVSLVLTYYSDKDMLNTKINGWCLQEILDHLSASYYTLTNLDDAIDVLKELNIEFTNISELVKHLVLQDFMNLEVKRVQVPAYIDEYTAGLVNDNADRYPQHLDEVTPSDFYETELNEIRYYMTHLR